MVCLYDGVVMFVMLFIVVRCKVLVCRLVFVLVVVLMYWYGIVMGCGWLVGRWFWCCVVVSWILVVGLVLVMLFLVLVIGYYVVIVCDYVVWMLGSLDLLVLVLLCGNVWVRWMWVLCLGVVYYVGGLLWLFVVVLVWWVWLLLLVVCLVVLVYLVFWLVVVLGIVSLFVSLCVYWMFCV